MKRRRLCLFLVLMIRPATGGAGGADDNWPQWRGATGNSCSADARVALSWDDHQGVAWKCQVPGWGNSTPAIWGDAVFLTSQDNDKLLLHRVDKKSGTVVWTQEVGKGSAKSVDPYG